MNVYAGPPRAMTRVTLRLVPLTPVHIGDGTELRPEEYVIEQPKAPTRSDDEDDRLAAPAKPMLCRFDQTAAIRAMTAAERARFARALDGANLGEAARELRKAGTRCIVERIPISSASASELAQAAENPLQRTGQVKPFLRSGGRPYIPGSSIKGALRTALASDALRPKAEGQTGWTHERALQAAFGLDPNDTSTDPLRFLHVADAFLPEASTLIDKTKVVKRGGDPATAPGGRGGIQMHYERTRARSDNPQDRTALDAALMVSDGLGVDRRELFRVASRFHWNLWQRERELFFRGCSGTVDAMDRLLKQIKLPDGGTAAERGFETATNYLLLRLGRFGHFESKSLEGVRRGHFPQARKPAEKIREPDAWGSTRTITRDARDNPIPFGWVIGWVVKEERA